MTLEESISRLRECVEEIKKELSKAFPVLNILKRNSEDER